MPIPQLLSSTMDVYQRYLTGTGGSNGSASTTSSTDTTFLNQALSGQGLSASQHAAAQDELRSLTIGSLFSAAGVSVDTSYLDQAVAGGGLSSGQLSAAQGELQQLLMNSLMGQASSSYARWQSGSTNMSGSGLQTPTLDQALSDGTLKPGDLKTAQSELEQRNRDLLLNMMA